MDSARLRVLRGGSTTEKCVNNCITLGYQPQCIGSSKQVQFAQLPLLGSSEPQVTVPCTFCVLSLSKKFFLGNFSEWAMSLCVYVCDCV